jgi:hypothetical protein
MAPILGIWASGASAAAITSYESIATVTVGSGGAASIAFASIPSTYTHLQIRGIARSSTASSTIVPIYAQINSTSTNQTSHLLYGNGSSVISTSALNANLIYLGYIGQDTTNANSFGASVIDVLDYASTDKYKTFRSLSGVDLNGSGLVGLFSGFLYANTNAISNITLYANAGGDSFAQYSSFALYGIKG